MDSYHKLKTLCYKIWSKYGDNFSYEEMDQLLNFPGPMRKLFGHWKIDWRGNKESEDLVHEYVDKKNSKPIHIENGGYDFYYNITNIDVSSETYEVIIQCKVDLSGYVTLIMTTNEKVKLSDAINNDDYGWEIKIEIQDCIYDDLSDYIVNKLGYGLSIELV